MAGLAPLPKFSGFASDGTPLSGGLLYSYAAGTSTPLATYTDYTGNVANTNPVVLDSRGEANVWLGESLYKLVLKDQLGNVIWTVDNVCADGTTNGIATTTYAAVRALSNFRPAYIYVKGRSGLGDGGQGLFYYDSADTTTSDNDGTVLVDASGGRWKRQYHGLLHDAWFGRTSSSHGGVAQNSSDYAVPGSNLLPSFSSITKTNFDGAGNHAAGTVGQLSASVSVSAYGHYMLKMVVNTTTPGRIQINLDSQDIFGDSGGGYYFSNATLLNVGAENNRSVDNTTFTFMVGTSSTAYSSLNIITDTAWAGSITLVELYQVTGTKFAIAGAGSTDTSFNNPVGLKVGALNRGDMAIGDRYTLGLMQYDGISPTPAWNLAAGVQALASNYKGDENTAFGTFALKYNEGSDNTAGGYSCFKYQTKGQENTGWGYKCGFSNTTGYKLALYGFWAGGDNTTGRENSHFGHYAGRKNQTGDNNTSAGSRASYSNLNGSGNVHIGAICAYHATLTYAFTSTVGIGYACNPVGNLSTVVGAGASAGTFGTPADYTTLLGASTSAVGPRTVVVGWSAVSAATGGYDTIIGAEAGQNVTGGANTFVGEAASKEAATQSWTNCSAFGYNTRVTGSNQVQLGNSSTTTYVYGTVQNRSDARDKEDVRNTVLGLDFINALRPVDYRWDLREDYDWGEKDGSKKRTRFHHGLIAQEVAATAQALGVEFGGYQDHLIAGGRDVKSIGYDELIAPLIKAVQELSTMVEQQAEEIRLLKAA